MQPALEVPSPQGPDQDPATAAPDGAAPFVRSIAADTAAVEAGGDRTEILFRRPSVVALRPACVVLGLTALGIAWLMATGALTLPSGGHWQPLTAPCVGLLGLAGVIQGLLGFERYVFFDLKERRVDILWECSVHCWGKSYSFDDIERIRVPVIYGRQGVFQDVPRGGRWSRWPLEFYLKDRFFPIVLETYHSEQDAGDAEADLHEAVFGAKPEPWTIPQGAVARA